MPSRPRSLPLADGWRGRLASRSPGLTVPGGGSSGFRVSAKDAGLRAGAVNETEADMNTLIAMEACGVLLCWAVLARAIWKWGPGLRSRSVRCPERRVSARILADQREPEFGSLRVMDVKGCSLLGKAPLACDKGCLVKL